MRFVGMHAVSPSFFVAKPALLNSDIKIMNKISELLREKILNSKTMCKVEKTVASIIDKLALNPTPYIIVSGLIGYFVGVLILFYESFFGGISFDVTEESKKFFFNNNSKYLIWVNLVLAQTTVWFLLIIPILSEVNKLRSEFNLSWAKYYWLYFILWLFIFFLLLLNLYIIYQYLTPPYLSETLLINHSLKERFILIPLGYFFPAFSLSGMLFVNSAILKVKSSDKDALSSYLTMRASLQKFLMVVGLQIGLATLSNAALQKAINIEIIYPIEFVFVIGLFFTLYIAIIYSPVFARVQNFGHGIVDSKLQAEKFSEGWFKEKEELENSLGLKASFKQSLETGVSILAPLLGSLIPSLLGGLAK